MQRYFVDGSWSEGEVRVTGPDAKHMQRVMRMQEGDSCYVVIDGETSVASVARFDGQDVVLRQEDVLDETVELPVQVTIASGLPKGDKLEWIVQKGTELGAHTFWPVAMKRSIVKWTGSKQARKEERLRTIAKEAAEQSHRTHVPDVAFHSSLDSLIEASETFDHRFFAYEEEARTNREAVAHPFKNVYHKQSMLVVFGPEGGIDEEEANVLKANGFLPIALGPRILRTETAPLYVLSALSYEFE
ncbi:16S rRNA (uracil(1498)-N(3))-methyltransferase [Planococcaceae bacterium Storch 2/2-2]|nr:16S rRNA (uracil(1498)-N(3))-methyltransferase [Planococcaceae bacterium Storch 2/2-2]